MQQSSTEATIAAAAAIAATAVIGVLSQQVWRQYCCEALQQQP
jgi:hypothetical protein